jgi:8-oxo-dGTP diphosphatase
MLKKLAAKIWKNLPSVLRIKTIRLTQKKFTASVGAVVTNERGEVLLLDHIWRPGSGWGMPGGFIEHGEQPEEALKREISEETGLELKNIGLFSVRVVERHIEFIFSAEAAAAGKAEVKSSEITAAKWFAPDIMPNEMSSTQKKIIGKVLNLNND